MRALLASPKIYRLQQGLMWSHRRDFHGMLVDIIKQMSRALPHHLRVLDIGCGDGKLSMLLGEHCEYIGVDLSERYIRHANDVYADYGTFHVGDLGDPAFYETFRETNPDLILMIGVLHHCPDDAVRRMFDRFVDRFTNAAFLSIDGVYVENQHRLAKLLLDMDRGEHIRTVDQYRSLLPTYDYALDNFLRVPFNMIMFYRNLDYPALSNRYFAEHGRATV